MDLRSKDAIESSKQHDIDMGNILIAEFMGVFHQRIFPPFTIGEKMYTLDELQYHTSWDWLMPVIEKIQDKHLENPELDYQYIDEIRLAVPNIQEVYYLVVKFIKDQNN